MAFPKGKKNPGAGRKKGVPNKTTRTVREGFELAFSALNAEGASTSLIEFAQRSDENLKAVYSMATKLIPVQVAADTESLAALLAAAGKATD